MKTFIFVLTVVFCSVALAKSPVDAVNKDRSGLALKGHDPVAYFTEGRPVKGSPTYAAQHNGAVFHFVSPENRDAFQKSPEKYAPQYGGYCAWAVSNNYTADADPSAWKILNGKLYLNYSKGVQSKWEPEAAKRIEDGDKNWPSLHR